MIDGSLIFLGLAWCSSSSLRHLQWSFAAPVLLFWLCRSLTTPSSWDMSLYRFPPPPYVNAPRPRCFCFGTSFSFTFSGVCCTAGANTSGDASRVGTAACQSEVTIPICKDYSPTKKKKKRNTSRLVCSLQLKWCGLCYCHNYNCWNHSFLACFKTIWRQIIWNSSYLLFHVKSSIEEFLIKSDCCQRSKENLQEEGGFPMIIRRLPSLCLYDHCNYELWRRSSLYNDF